MSNPTITADELLDFMIEMDIKYCGYGIPIAMIAHELDITFKQLWPPMQELIDKNLVVELVEPDTGHTCGFALRDEARHLPRWHEAHIKMLKQLSVDLPFVIGHEERIKAAEEAAERDKHHE